MSTLLHMPPRMSTRNLVGYDDDDDDEVEEDDKQEHVVEQDVKPPPPPIQLSNPLFVQWCEKLLTSNEENETSTISFADKLRSMDLFWRPNLLEFMCSEHGLNPHASRFPKRVFHPQRNRLGSKLLESRGQTVGEEGVITIDESLLYPEIEQDTGGIIQPDGTISRKLASAVSVSRTLSDPMASREIHKERRTLDAREDLNDKGTLEQSEETARISARDDNRERRGEQKRSSSVDRKRRRRSEEDYGGDNKHKRNDHGRDRERRRSRSPEGQRRGRRRS